MSSDMGGLVVGPQANWTAVWNNSGDAYFDNVVLLLNGGTTDGSNQIIDSSSYARAITANGNAQIDTAQNFSSGIGAVYIDSPTASSANYVSASDASELSPGAQDFCIDVKCRWDTTNVDNFSPVFLAKRAASNFELNFSYINGSIYLDYSTDGTNVTSLTTAWTPTADTDYNIRFNRNGTTGRFFVNGTQQGADKTVTGTIFSGTALLSLFTDNVNVTKFTGWMKVRFTVGTYRDAGDYTPDVSWKKSGNISGVINSVPTLNNLRITLIRLADGSLVESQAVTGTTYAFAQQTYSDTHAVILHSTSDTSFVPQMKLVYPS